MSRIEKTMQVNVPIDQCYRTLLQFERYADFLPHVESIRHKGHPDVWQWRVILPNRQVMNWDIEIQGGRHQHHSLSWHTIREADVAHSGAITLHPAGDDRTELHMVVEYKTYAAANPDDNEVMQYLDRDFEALKSQLESGKIFTTPETLNKM